MIPNGIVGTALNQLVFPAQEAEIKIARLENSVPLNRIKDILGCTKTQAEQLALHGLISSVVPIAEDQHVGLTRGDFNRDDLLQFLDQASGRAEKTHAQCDGFADLTQVARPILSAREILGWQLDGKLKHTRLLSDAHGRPYLGAANTASVQDLAGTACATGTELDRVNAKFMTAALFGRFFEMNHLKAKALIEQQEVDPVFDSK